MVRELKSHRRGPQITGIGPYDPNLAPKPPGKWRGWWAVAAVALVVMLGAGVWWQQGTSVPSVVSQGSTDAPPVSATNEVVETLEEPAMPDLPFGMATGLTVGGETEAAVQYGSVRIVATAQDYAQEYLGKTAKRLRLDTNEWVAVANLPQTLSNQTCGLVEVALEADGFKADPASRRVLIQESRTNDAIFVLAPLPATLTVTCNVSSAELEIVGIKSQTAKPISIPSLKPLGLTVASPGWRTQKMKLGSMNPGKAYAKSVILEQEAGALRIEATVPTNAEAYFQGLDKQIRLRTNDWKTVKTLPVVETGLACKVHPVELQVAGFEVGRGVPTEPLVRDGQTTTVSFALSPLPATLKVSCNVTGAFIQINDQPSTVSNSLPVPSLQSLSVTVSATGYVAQVVKLGPMKPGKAYRQEVKLGPVLGAAGTATGGVGDPLTVDLGKGVKVDMVWIAPGKFTMGSVADPQRFNTHDSPPHQVVLTEGFWIGKYEVTQKQWVQVMGRNPSIFNYPDHPVEKVSWNDCQDYIRKLNSMFPTHKFRLPTEAEWEYCCRAGTTTKFNTGDENSDLDRAGWHGGNSEASTHPVGLKTPNQWGLYDMHGNVEEWCSDFYGPYPTGTVTNPSGATSGGSLNARVTRGQTWAGNYPYDGGCGRQLAHGIEPYWSSAYQGVRLVCTPLSGDGENVGGN